MKFDKKKIFTLIYVAIGWFAMFIFLFSVGTYITNSLILGLIATILLQIIPDYLVFFRGKGKVNG